MAFNIVINTEQANKNIDKLGENIVSLGDKAEAAGKKAKQHLDFGSLAKSEIAAVRASFKELEGIVNSLAASLKKQAGMLGEVSKAKKDYISEAQKSSKAILDETRALQKVADQTQKALDKQKAATAAKKAATSEVQKYVAALDAQNVKMSSSEQKLLSLKKGWSDLSKEQQQAALHTLRVNQALSQTEGLVKRQLTPLEQYRKNLQNLKIGREEYERTGGRVGLSQIAYLRGVEAANKALDEHTKKNLLAGKSLRQFAADSHVGTQAAAGFRAMLSATNASFGVFTGQTILVATAVYAVTKAIASTIKAGAEFERSFERSATIMGEFKNTSKDAAKPMYELTAAGQLVRKEVIRLGEETQYSAEQVSEAVRYLAASGYTAAEVMNSLEAVVTLGAVAFIDLDKAADMAANILRAFGKQSGELMHIVNMMAVAVNESNVNMEQLARSMVYVGPAANAAGISLEQTTAAIAILANVGIKGSMAGTALRRIITSLADPSAKAEATLKKLGVTIQKTAEGNIDLVGTFQQLNEKQADLGDLKNIVGLWAVSSAAALAKVSVGVDATSNQFLKFQERLMGVTDDAVQMRKAMQDNVLMSLERVQSSINAIQIRAFDRIGPQIKTILDTIDAALDKNGKSISEWIAKIAVGVAKGVQFVIDNFQLITTFLLGWGVGKLIRSALGGIASAFGAVTPAKKAYMALLAQEKIETDAVTASLLRYTEAQVAAARVATASARTRAVAATTAATMPGGIIIPPGARTAGAAAVGSSAAAAANTATAVSLTRVAAGAAAATGAIALLGRGFTALMGVIRGALGLLGGLPGILFTIASFLAINWLTSTDAAATSTDALTESIDKFNLALENNAEVLNKMSKDALKTMQDELVKAKDAAVKSLDELDKKITDLRAKQEALKKQTQVPAIGFDTPGGRGGNNVVMRQAELRTTTNELAEAEKKRAETATKVAEANEKLGISQEAVNNLNESGKNSLIEMKPAYAQVTGALDTLIGKADEELALAGKTGIELYRAKVAREAETGSIVIHTDALNAQIEAQKAIQKSHREGDPEYAAATARLKELNAERDTTVKKLKEQKIEEIAQILNAAEVEKKSREKANAFKGEAEQLSELTMKLAELNKFNSKLINDSQQLITYLTNLGISAENAKRAMAIKTDEMRLDYLSDVLAEIDPRFKSFADTIRKSSESALSFDDVMAVTADILKRTGLSGAALEAELKRLAPTLRNISDGTADGNKRAQELIKSVNDEILKFNQLEYAASSVTAAFGPMNAEQRDAVTIALKLKNAMSTFGPIFGDMKSDQEKFAIAQEQLNILIKQFPELADKAIGAMDRWKEANTAVGQVSLSIEQIQGQMQALATGGTTGLAEFNRLWELTGGHIENATEELRQLVRQEEQLKQMQQIYADFYGGIEDMVRGVLDGTIKSSKDMVKSIKNIFKKMLIDLAIMAAKNAIALSVNTGGAGGGTGFWGNLFNMGVSAFTGGTGKGGGGSVVGNVLAGAGGNTAATAAGGTGGMGYFGNLIWPYAGKIAASSAGSLAAGAAPYAGALGGAWYGSRQGDGGLGTAGATAAGAIAGYYAGTVAASAITYAGAAYGATAAAGAGTAAAATAGGAAAGASAGLAAIPIVGWVAAIALIVDKVTGGKIFGSKYKPESVRETVTFGKDGMDVKAFLTEWRYRSQLSQAMGRFGGALLPSDWGDKDRRGKEIPIPPEMMKALMKVFESLNRTITKAAKTLGIEAIDMLDATFETITTYDKKGKVKRTEYIGTINGVKYEEEWETFQKRLHAEIIIATIDKALPDVARAVDQIIADIGDRTFEENDGRFGPGGGVLAENGVIRPPTEDEQERTRLAAMQEASRVAERWRDNVDLLLEGAQMMLTVAKDMLRGDNLLGDGGTLTQIVDLVEDMQQEGESLSDTYKRLKEVTDFMRNALEAAGLEVKWSGAQFVVFANDFAEAAGGIDAASQKWNNFFNRFYDSIERREQNFNVLTSRRDEALGRVGLDRNTSMEDFRAQFELNLPSMTGQELNDWLDAGNALADVFDVVTATLNRFYSEADRQERQFNALLVHRTDALTSIGLSPTISMEDFRDQFEAALPTLSDDELSDWVEAGNAMADAFDAVRVVADGLTNQLASLVSTANEGNAVISMTDDAFADFLDNIDKTIDNLRRYGGEDALSDFSNRFQMSLDAQVGWRQYVMQLRAVDRQYQANTRVARRLGLATDQLTKIETYAALQRMRILNELTDSINDMLGQLHTMDEEAIERANAAASSYWDDQAAASQQAMETQRELFESAQQAIKDITKFLNDININDMSPASLQTRLGESRRQFDDLIRRAMAGDTEAMQELTQSAQNYLSLGQEFYGSTTDYAQIFNYVNSTLQAVRDRLSLIRDPGQPASGGTGGGGAGGSSSWSDRYTAAEAERDRRNRFQLALNIAEQIGEMHIATGRDIEDLMRSFDTSIKELAEYMGIDIRNLDENSAANIAMLATALGMSTADIMQELGVSIFDLAASFGLNISTLDTSLATKLGELATLMGLSSIQLAEQLGIDLVALAGSFNVDITSLGDKTVEGLGAMATAMGVNIFDLMTALGVNIVDLATAIGLNFDQLNTENWAAFVQFANTLGTDIIALSTSLGGSIDQIGDLIAGTVSASLEDLPDLAPDLLASLSPLLQAIRDADTTGEINTAIQAVRNYINSLPEDQRDALEPVFNALLGTAGVDGSLAETKRAIEDIGEDQIDLQEEIRDRAGSIKSATEAMASKMTTMADSLGDAVRHLRDIKAALGGSTGATGAINQMEASSMSALTWAMSGESDGYSEFQADDGGLADRVAAMERTTSNVQSARSPDEAKCLDEIAVATDKTAQKTEKVEEAVVMMARVIAEQQAQIIDIQKQLLQEKKRERKAAERRSVPSNTGNRK